MTPSHAQRAARTRKLLWVIATLATIGAFAAYMGWPTLLRLKIQGARQRAAVALLDYAPPKGLIVYDDDHSQSRTFLQQGNYETEGIWRGVFYIPPPMMAEGAPVPREPGDKGAVFLHGMSDGQQRLLVLVDIKRQYAENGRWIMLEPHVYRRVLDVDSPPWEEIGKSPPLTISLRPDDKLRLYAAQLDPKDRSHFTIDGAVNGNRPFICDGYWTPATHEVRLVARRDSGLDLTPLARPGD
jgi:hypothetical protein